MFHWFLFYSVLLVSSYTCLGDFGNFFGSNKDDWVDPTDMFNYDHREKKMRENYYAKDEYGDIATPEPTEALEQCKLDLSKCPTTCNEEDLGIEDVISKLSKFQDNLEFINYMKIFCENKIGYKLDVDQCKLKLKECESKHVFKDEENDDSLGTIYFKQYIRRLLKDVNILEVPTGENVYYNIELKLNNGDLYALKSFANSNLGNIQDAHNALLKIVSIVYQTGGYKPPTFNENLLEFIGGQSTLIVLIGISSSFLVSIWMLTRIDFFSYALVIKMFWLCIFMLFVISIPWNWWHLYQVKLTEKHIDVLKGVPSQCQYGTSAGGSLWYSFKSMFSVDVDPCEKYFKGLMVNPLTEVPPTKAIAVTVTKILVEPLEHIGESINLLIKKSLDGLPLHLQITVLFIIVFLVIFILLLSCGYRIGGFFNLIDLQPRPQITYTGMPNSNVQYLTQNQQCRIQEIPMDRIDYASDSHANCNIQKIEYVSSISNSSSVADIKQIDSKQNKTTFSVHGGKSHKSHDHAENISITDTYSKSPGDDVDANEDAKAQLLSSTQSKSDKISNLTEKKSTRNIFSKHPNNLDVNEDINTKSVSSKHSRIPKISNLTEKKTVKGTSSIPSEDFLDGNEDNNDKFVSFKLSECIKVPNLIETKSTEDTCQKNPQDNVEIYEDIKTESIDDDAFDMCNSLTSNLNLCHSIKKTCPDKSINEIDTDDIEEENSDIEVIDGEAI